ncbi:unnamed protein product, partial [Haemonchus placei]|uniref:Secreted protein n=1 Tax=Haemonchus placei TaxID=6290 RepID=A0A0N4W008_HAEPC
LKCLLLTWIIFTEFFSIIRHPCERSRDSVIAQSMDQIKIVRLFCFLFQRVGTRIAQNHSEGTLRSNGCSFSGPQEELK